MELSQEFLIDMAINGAGYLLAGTISVLLYAMFQKKKSHVEFDEVIDVSPLTEQPTEMSVSQQATSERKVEFITFGTGSEIHTPIEKSIKSDRNKNERMNRKDAINLAKKMLLAGASNEKIKRVLPVSESELALLNLNIK